MRLAAGRWLPGRRPGPPLQRQHQVRAALAAGQCMQLVDDDGADIAEHGPARFAVSRMCSDSGVVTRMCGNRHQRPQRPVIAGTHRRAAASPVPIPAAGRDAAAVAAGSFDIVGQRLQRRHIQHLHGIGSGAMLASAHQRVDRGQERGQVCRIGRCCHQNVAAACRHLPARTCAGVGVPNWPVTSWKRLGGSARARCRIDPGTAPSRNGVGSASGSLAVTRTMPVRLREGSWRYRATLQAQWMRLFPGLFRSGITPENAPQAASAPGAAVAMQAAVRCAPAHPTHPFAGEGGSNSSSCEH